MIPLIYVLILNWNGKEDTLACLSSLEKVTYPNFKVLVMDNGSKEDPSLEISKSFPKTAFLQNGANLGYAEGNNRGIRYALQNQADAVLLLNNDTIVSPNFLDPLVEAMQEKEKGGIFGSKSLQFYKENTLDHLGGFWENEKAEFICPHQNQKDQVLSPFEVDYASGCCLLLTRKVLEEVGFLDPRFFLLWEESDLCTRAKKKGFEIWMIPDSVIWHKVSASFSGKPLLHYYWWRNRLLFIEKNFSFSERKKLYTSVVFWQIVKEYRHLVCKSLQAFYYRIFFPEKWDAKRKLKYRRIQAGCRGIKDYFLRKFAGPIKVK